MSPPVVTSIDVTSLPRVARGKVRDLYEVNDSTLLFATTDRISAYDVVMENGIPYKGAVLTQLTAHWFSVLKEKIPDLQTHFITLDPPAGLTPAEIDLVRGRSMQVRKYEVFPIEAIVRTYPVPSVFIMTISTAVYERPPAYRKYDGQQKYSSYCTYLLMR